ncbi:hypothetical protein GCM10008933_00870 [Paenibacillus motobuensis]|uniref:Uncharacterized protein n=2 Tax=Paenibacillus motobuensis TaxID=295324 RepID=A0ABN0XVT7_9BACL
MVIRLFQNEGLGAYIVMNIPKNPIRLKETKAEIVVRSVPGADTTLQVVKLPDRSEVAPGETVHYTAANRCP